jgi:hypothetical protein
MRDEKLQGSYFENKAVQRKNKRDYFLNNCGQRKNNADYFQNNCLHLKITRIISPLKSIIFPKKYLKIRISFNKHRHFPKSRRKSRLAGARASLCPRSG